MRICRIAIENFANFDSVDFATDDSQLWLPGYPQCAKCESVVACKFFNPCTDERSHLGRIK